MTLATLANWWTGVILPWAVESTLVGLALLGLLRLTRGSAPGLRYALATLGLLKMAIPPQLLPVGLLSMGVVGSETGTIAPIGAPLTGTQPGQLVLGLLALVHLVGVAAGTLLLTRRALELRRLRASGQPVGPTLERMSTELSREIGLRRRPRVIECLSVRVPFATGLLTPTVVLPTGLASMSDPEALRGLLAHELLHLHRRDLWMTWLRAIVVTFWWPSPVGRALAAVHERATEELCDDAVLSGGHTTARDYATSLLAVATLAVRRRGALVANAVGPSGLENRILRFLSPDTHGQPSAGRPRKGRRWLTGLAALALAALLLPASTTGRVSAAGWTTSIHFEHGEAPGEAGGSRFRHAPPTHGRHDHNHDH